MQLHAMKLVKIIGEKRLTPSVVGMLKELGIGGYTVYDVRGEGDYGLRLGGTEETANVIIEIITSEQNADTILTALRDDYFADYAVITYVSEVKVIRKEKFL